MTHSHAPVAQVLGLLTAHWTAASVHCAVDLGVFDAVGETPVSAPELAGKLDADPEALDRLLRALTHHGLLERSADGRYLHTAASGLLRTGARPELVPVARLFGLPELSEPWHHLADAVRTGGPVFEGIFGSDFYRHFTEEVPEAGALFNDGMTALTRLAAADVAKTLDLTGAATVADIAGGHGLLLAELLRQNPAVHGVLLDLPTVLDGACEELREDGALADRCRLVPGDYQHSVTVAADVYLLKNILHNRDDDTCVRLLRTIADSAPPGARVVAVERVIGAGGPFEGHNNSMDLLMLLILGGREGTDDQFAALFRSAGLAFRGVTPLGYGQQALVEARAD